MLFLSYTVLLFTATLAPLQESQTKNFNFFSFEHRDKVVHFLLFFVFTLLLKLTYRKLSKSQLLIIPILIGIFIECLQFALNLGRTFDLYDILANSLGVLTASFFVNSQTDHSKN